MRGKPSRHVGFAAFTISLLSVLTQPAAAKLVTRTSLPLKADGRHIVDKHGSKVILECINWYGANLINMTVGGLGSLPIATIVTRIVELGFNCVRLPYSLELLGETRLKDWNRTIINPRVNPDLVRLSALGVFDQTIAAITSAGLMVILNNHASSAMWCCGLIDGEGLWHNTEFSTEAWLRHLEMMAKRYEPDPLVVAFDMRNEIRASWRPSWDFFPFKGEAYWGEGPRDQDWARAAVKGGLRISQSNPNLLIIISGLAFGINLANVSEMPIHLTTPELKGRVVYTAHEYPWNNIHTIVADNLPVAISSLWHMWFALVVVWIGHLFRHRLPRFCACIRLLLVHKKGLNCCSLRFSSLTGAVCHRLISALMIFSLLCVCCTSFQIYYTRRTWGIFLPYLACYLCLIMSVSWMCAILALAASLTSSVAVWDTESTQTFLGDVEMPRVSHDRQKLTSSSLREASDDEASKASEDSMFSARSVDDDSPTRTRIETQAGLNRRVLDLNGRLVDRAWEDKLRWRKSSLIGLNIVALIILILVQRHASSYEAFKHELDTRWGFILHSGNASAPVWLGEFGTNHQSQWWNYTLKYLRENEIGWAYWALNGEKWPEEDETFGLLTPDYSEIRHAWKLADLKMLMGNQSA